MRDIYIDFRSYEDFMNLFHMDIEKKLFFVNNSKFYKKWTAIKSVRNTIFTAIIHELNAEIHQNKRE